MSRIHVTCSTWHLPLRAGIALVVCLLLAPALGLTAPKWVRVSLPGSDTDASMTVAWNDSAGGVSEVQYGPAGAAMTLQAKGASFKGKGGIGTVHEVTLTGLQANTKYDYRVGGAGAWSKTYNFQTAPADGCTAFSFIAGGDHRSDDDAGANPKWKPIIGDMKALSPRFILESGDLVRDGADEKQWFNHMDMGEALLPWIPMMPAMGNHDSDDLEGAQAYYNQIFALPKDDLSKTEDFWATVYGNVLVIALSTQTYNNDDFAAQGKWLEQILAKHKDVTWKIAFYHHPSYSSYVDLKIADLNHPPNENGQNKVFLPLFDKYGVDLVFAGHNHFYERFKPFKGGKVVPAGQGTVHVTSGGTGAFTYDVIDIGLFKIEPMKIICGEGVFGVGGGIAEGSVICSGKNHFVLVSVDGNKLAAKVLATSAQNFGTSAKNKMQIDAFSLTKPGTPTCKPAPPLPDAGSTDAGEQDAGSADVGAAADAGTAATDAGTAATDAGEADGGTAKVDAGAAAADASTVEDTAVGPGDPDAAGPNNPDVGGTLDAPSEADIGGAVQTDVGTAPASDAIGDPGHSGGNQGASAANSGSSSAGCSSAPATGRDFAGLMLLLLACGAIVWRPRRLS